MKKNNNKGFTLAELLIVVAIIAVLVAIAIPIFTTQLEKAREATDIANVRSSYAVVVAEALTQEKPAEVTAEVTLKQQQDDWQGVNPTSTLAQLGANFSGITSGNPAEVEVDGTPTASGKATITWTPAVKADEDAVVTIHFE